MAEFNNPAIRIEDVQGLPDTTSTKTGARAIDYVKHSGRGKIFKIGLGNHQTEVIETTTTGIPFDEVDNRARIDSSRWKRRLATSPFVNTLRAEA